MEHGGRGGNAVKLSVVKFNRTEITIPPGVELVGQRILYRALPPLHNGHLIGPIPELRCVVASAKTCLANADQSLGLLNYGLPGQVFPSPNNGNFISKNFISVTDQPWDPDHLRLEPGIWADPKTQSSTPDPDCPVFLARLVVYPKRTGGNSSPSFFFKNPTVIVNPKVATSEGAVGSWRER